MCVWLCVCVLEQNRARFAAEPALRLPIAVEKTLVIAILHRHRQPFANATINFALRGRRLPRRGVHAAGAQPPPWSKKGSRARSPRAQRLVCLLHTHQHAPAACRADADHAHVPHTGHVRGLHGRHKRMALYTSALQHTPHALRKQHPSQRSMRRLQRWLETTTRCWAAHCTPTSCGLQLAAVIQHLRLLPTNHLG